MPSAPATIPNLVDALTLQSSGQAQLTLVPTTAAARSLRRAFDSAQRARGLSAWEPPPILTWPHFLERLWSEAVISGTEPRLLLNPTQVHALWLEIIAANQPETTLTPTDALASLAASAWSLASAYNATNKLRAAATTHDSRIFADWAAAFQRECDRNGYLSQAALESALQNHLESANLNAPSTLTLLNFLEFTPTQTALLATLRTRGTTITKESIAPRPAATREVYAATSETDELQTSARWINTFLRANPTSTVAILLPTPNDRPALESALRETLAPELQLITEDITSTPFEFASAVPLTTQPIIANALDLVQWTHAPLEINKVSNLLLSPYLNDPNTLDANARFDANTLRQIDLLRPEIKINDLLQLSNNSIAWLESLNRYISKFNTQSNHSYAEWAEHMRRLLAAAGWPGNLAQRPLTSREFEAVQAWDGLLDQITTLDYRGLRVPLTAFLEALIRQASNAGFLPPTTHAPIQILTPDAAIGAIFDAVVVLRATDSNLPAPERPNPLLGWQLQASLNMPGTSSTHSSDRHKRLLNQLLSSPHFLATYTPETPGGTQTLSPYIAAKNLAELHTIHQLTASPIKLDIMPDSAPLPVLANAHIRGGATVLKLQAACGFRAFAEMRLWATTLEIPDAGFDARESGDLVHRSMRKFWTVAKSQADLLAMSAETRADLLNRSIEAAFSRNLKIESPWDKAYLAIQKERLRNLLTSWLDQEILRGPFVVVGLEAEQSIQVGPLNLHLRIDRLDAVSDGLVLIDYKTGSAAKPADWFTDRPDDPQLPLYALLPEAGQLKALAFAKIRPGSEMKWQGYQAETGILPTKETVSLDELVTEWRTTLTALAEDFATGIARVDPKNFPKTCLHCAQRLLCRLDPAALLADTEEEGNEEFAHG